MKRLFWTVCLFLGSLHSAHAQPVVNTSVRCEDGAFAITAPITEVFAGAGNNEIVALAPLSRIQVHRWQLQSTADIQLKFITGTGTDCATGETDLTGRMDIFSTVNRTVDSLTLSPPMTLPVAKALCLDASGAATITGAVTYCLVQ
jgi:hypothetical protein